MDPRRPSSDRDLPDHLNRYSHDVIGAAIEVHRHLGPGHLESAYQHALAHEFRLREIRFAQELDCVVRYKGQEVSRSRIDFVVEDELVVELKAMESILPIHRAQVRSYLKAGPFNLGLLINFNVPVLRDGIARIIWTHHRDPLPAL